MFWREGIFKCCADSLSTKKTIMRTIEGRKGEEMGGKGDGGEKGVRRYFLR